MTDPLVAVCTITADRKHAANYGIPHILEYPDMAYYVNVESYFSPSWVNPGLTGATWYEGFFDEKVLPVYPDAVLDPWSAWGHWRPRPDPASDQDQRRLLGIVTARNMARDFARHIGAEWLLFLDADVIVPPDSIQRLLEVAAFTGDKLLGGVVPSRANNGDNYIFKADPRITIIPNAEQQTKIRAGKRLSEQEIRLYGIHTRGVQHATCGFMFIHRDLYEPLAFSLYASTATDFYVDPETGKRNVGLSEDPLYGICAQKWFGTRWRLRLDLIAQHLGGLGPEEAGVSYLDGRPQ